MKEVEKKLVEKIALQVLNDYEEKHKDHAESMACVL